MKSKKKKLLKSYISEKEYCAIEAKFNNISNHVHIFVNFLKKNILNQINHDNLLDIGAGPGFITKKLANYFESTTIIEINPEYEKYYKSHGFNYFISNFQTMNIKTKYDLVICSHVLYHVEIANRKMFLLNLINLIKEGGLAIIAMVAPRGQFHQLCKTINSEYTNSYKIMNLLNELGIDYKTYSSICYYATTNEKYFTKLVKMFAIDDCFTPIEYQKLSRYKKTKIQEKIEHFIKINKNKAGKFKFLTEEDYIVIGK